MDELDDAFKIGLEVLLVELKDLELGDRALVFDEEVVLCWR